MAWKAVPLLCWVALVHASTDVACLMSLQDDGTAPLSLQHHEHTEDAAQKIVKELGLGYQSPFAELAGNRTIEAVLAETSGLNAILVVVPGRKAPLRRGADRGEPFLAVHGEEGEAGPLGTALALHALNSAAAVLEGFLGRHLFPLRHYIMLHPIKLGHPLGQARPYAVYDVSGGTVYLDVSMLQNLHQIPEDSMGAIGEFGSELFRSFVNKLQGATPHPPWPIDRLSRINRWADLFNSAAPSAMYAAMAMGSVPLWLCISCVLVLGMGFPFVFNLGLGAIAEQLCEHFALPTDECNDLWYGAFALAMILSFASAIPIVYICRLPKCVQQHVCLSTQ